MELKKGYKQTEIGVVPEDWEIADLGNILNRVADVDHYMPKTEKYGVPYVMTGDLQELAGNIDFDNCKKISLVDYKKLSKKIKNTKGDIILARYATVGTVSFVNIDFDFVVSYSCVTIKPDNSKLLSLFLFYYFKSGLFKIEVKNKVNANIQDNVGIQDLIKIQIPLPLLPEQTAIATVLSDTDHLLQALQKKIAKKRLIKEGAMQELLKPKEGWEVKTLGEVVLSVQLGGNYSNSEVPTKYPLIKMGNILRGNILLSKLAYIPIGENVNEKDKLNRGDVIFNTRNTLDLVGKVAIWNNELPIGYFNSNIMRLKFKDSLISSNRFMNYIFNSKKIISDLKNIATGTTSVAAIYTRDLLKVYCSIPSKQEQTRIATILSDMDTEIENLENKFAKYEQVKQGLMQNLLTGKIRLV